MREILFRGKREDNGEWVYGDLRQDHDLEQAFISYWDYYTGESGIEREPFEYEVIPETVGQFADLLYDKNGTKIFEHDIVRCDFNSAPPMNGKVVFENGAFGLRWKHHGSGVENFAAFECICNVEYTVIGRIHDNPELMESEVTI